MTLRDYLHILRTRWMILFATVVVALIGAAALTLLTTPMYQASTRLFVSSTSGASATELYQGNRLSQERVLSYTELLTGQTLAQRAINKLGLAMTPDELQANVKATAKIDTVLINVSVLDSSPVRARDIANTLSDEFVIMARELETPPDGGTPDARVIVEQRASVPDHPVIPRTFRNIAVGLCLGVLVGIALAVLREMLDNTVKDRETFEHISDVGLVGSIPHDKERLNQAAISFDTNNSAIAEAFRKLRTNLQFLGVDDRPRVIVVTSAMPSAGKSTTAINIALALAEAEHNVVLVDGDMRRPMLDKYLGLLGPVGFSTVLSGGASLADVLQKTRFPHLTVLTSGTVPPNPSELLGSMAAQRLLSELKAEFDYVIVDSSPLLAVTDGAILAAHADGALILARYGRTKRDQLAQAVGNLADVGASILGAVFTMTPARRNASYNYSYYGYGSVQTPSRDVPLPTLDDGAPVKAAHSASD